jgi:hypothetical protein
VKWSRLPTLQRHPCPLWVVAAERRSRANLLMVSFRATSMKFAGEVSLRGVDVRSGPCGTICLQKSRSEPLGVSGGTARGERGNRSAEREEERRWPGTGSNCRPHDFQSSSQNRSLSHLRGLTCKNVAAALPNKVIRTLSAHQGRLLFSIRHCKHSSAEHLVLHAHTKHAIRGSPGTIRSAVHEGPGRRSSPPGLPRSLSNQLPRLPVVI